jgi:hypothetical protein
VAARFGNAGQSDYAMANEVLNKVAAVEHRRREGRCLVRSIGWGPWDGGMVTPSLRSHFEERGVALLPLDEGARRFVQETSSAPSAEVEILIAGEGTRALGGSTDELTFEIHVDATSHPYLDGHRIQNRPVVPVALALEWMARAARMLAPERRLGACRDLQVVRGIRIEQFEGQGQRIVVHARRAPGEIAMELRSLDGQVHYRGIIELADGAPATARPPFAAPAGGAMIGPAALYDGDVLFHGPAFQVFASSVQIADEGAAGTVQGVRGMRWAGTSWLTDVAAVDGGLQLALLWAQRVLGGAALPTSVGSYRFHREGLVADRLRVVLRRQAVRGARALCDIDFIDGDGRLVAELCSVEVHLRPDQQMVSPLRKAAAGGK